MATPVKDAKMRNDNWRAHRRRVILLVVTILVFLTVLIDLSPVGGNMRFYLKWSACGAKPVQVQSLPGNAWYEDSPTFPLIFRNQSWYCTPIEAEKAGYSAYPNSFSFPHLEK